jgi:hypothetical protein
MLNFRYLPFPKCLTILERYPASMKKIVRSNSMSGTVEQTLKKLEKIFEKNKASSVPEGTLGNMLANY